MYRRQRQQLRPTATDDDASCTGCTNPIADNYYAGADIDDGTCIISGCTDTEACNFFAEANNENGSCLYPIDLYGVDNVDCDGVCLNDADGDGTCDEDEELDEVLDIINDGQRPRLHHFHHHRPRSVRWWRFQQLRRRL